MNITPPHTHRHTQVGWFDLTKDRNKFVLFFVYSFSLLFFLSPDSYLYDVFFRCDSSCFYTAGKAWMNGMIPYVDFTDSKGPLLWLIYGMGYLLNSHSYVGVFWVSCVFYAVSFMFAYKTCRLYLGRRASALVTSLLPAFIFFQSLHNEVLSEDFCITFVFVSLYCLCRVQNGVDKRRLFGYSFAVGVCMACNLFIKWNFFFMLGGVALALLFVSVSRMKTLTALWGGLLGIAAPAVPFLAYFTLQGNLGAFITEYFINTMGTVKNVSPQINYPAIIWGMEIVMFAGIAAVCRRHKGSWGIMFSFLVFCAGLSVSLFDHYYVILTPFGIFPLMCVVSFAESKVRLQKCAAVVLCVLCVLGSTAMSVHYKRLLGASVFASDGNGRRQYYDISRLMATKEKPTVMCYDLDFGFGVLADALPACKYWISQYGSTSAMRHERERALRERKADFLVAYHFAEIPEEKLRRCGYVHCGDVDFECKGDSQSVSVYCKKELYRKLPPVKLRTIDLLLKRNLLCKDE